MYSGNASDRELVFSQCVKKRTDAKTLSHFADRLMVERQIARGYTARVSFRGHVGILSFTRVLFRIDREDP